ncbi:hypothetical protein [Bacillus mycoides]|uniref:hypothetical protein n=1 Tax=Bacillus mycoides TaxID=1405 RepID=UPI00187A82AC|nr:hypothetical protein [Bacillus mycoides]
MKKLLVMLKRSFQMLLITMSMLLVALNLLQPEAPQTQVLEQPKVTEKPVIPQLEKPPLEQTPKKSKSIFRQQAVKPKINT